MPSFAEMNHKVTVSVGLIIALCVATFLITSFYQEQITLEERMDKRYKRIDSRLDNLEKTIFKQ